MPSSKPQPSQNNRRRAREREPDARTGRPTGDIKAKRAELLASAVSVIAQEGYAGASLRKVAQHAGFSTGATSYYFASKEEMVIAVAHNLWEQFEATMERNPAQVDVKALIEMWLEWISIDAPEGWLAWLQLLFHARHEPVFANVIKQLYARFSQAFAALLEEGQRQGSIRSDIPADVLADHLSTISDGWLMMMPIDPQRFGEARGKILLDALVTLIAPPQAQQPSRSSKARATTEKLS